MFRRPRRSDPPASLVNATNQFLEGRVESAVLMLERVGAASRGDHRALSVMQFMLATLETMARHDPEFRRERRDLRRRLLVLVSSATQRCDRLSGSGMDSHPPCGGPKAQRLQG